VRVSDPASSGAEDLVRSLRGTGTRKLPIVSGFAATIPADRLPALLSSSAISKLCGDGVPHMAGVNMGHYDRLSPNTDCRCTDGSTDVSEVLAGLQWIMANRAAYDIRVLNLSFGTDSTQPYLIDPLDFAVEQVWRSGILVVVAAGNRGPGGGTINKPADDPYV